MAGLAYTIGYLVQVALATKSGKNEILQIYVYQRDNVLET